MRKLTYFVSHSIDGYIAAPDGSWDFLMAYQDLTAWMLENLPETIPAHVHAALGTTAALAQYDTVVMGRATYDPGLAIGIASPYPHLRQYVVTKSITDSPDPGVTLVADEPVAAVRALKAEDGDKGIWLAGGGTLAAALYDEIDELLLKTYPVLAGDGIPLFRGAAFDPAAFTLTEHRTFPDGGILTRYTRAS
ncbi:dihydrofolate reductase family protein [Yinghuangia seranimata]|uniref:dihydrofolate reductase family protein n=1 Tax=Yinghuangia seranimata TaxID=408067 RepID=UPI00248C8730|nr:dihydrofolate reductase [Yinghuangia seranimata]MDI2126002.1 dihydrofolate reductase [Yinghuangia seranimata]